MSDKSSKFKTSFRGYDKNDVNTYIAAVGAEMKAKEEMLETSRQRFERDLELSETKLKTSEQKLDELAIELFNAQTRLAELEESVKDYDVAAAERDELAIELHLSEERERKLKESAMGLSSRIAELESEFSEIGHLVGVENDEELTQKAALYDKLSDRIGEIMLSADTNAEQLLTGASNRADEILLNAQKEANDIVKAAEAEADKIRSRYKEMAGGYCDEVEIFVSEIRDYIESFVRDISAKSAELEHKIDFMSLPDQPQKPEIPAQCREKDEAAQETSKPKRHYSTIDEKIESFFKKTMATINSFKNRK